MLDHQRWDHVKLMTSLSSDLPVVFCSSQEWPTCLWVTSLASSRLFLSQSLGNSPPPAANLSLSPSPPAPVPPVRVIDMVPGKPCLRPGQDFLLYLYMHVYACVCICVYKYVISGNSLGSSVYVCNHWSIWVYLSLPSRLGSVYPGLIIMEGSETAFLSFIPPSISLSHLSSEFVWQRGGLDWI